MISANRCFIDSSALIGFFSELDSLHIKAKTTLKLLTRNRTKFYLSDYVVDETLTRVKQKTDAFQATIARGVIFNMISTGKFRLLWTTRSVFQNTISIFESHPTPKTFSFTDANILAHIRIKNIPILFTFDRDFKKLGVKTIPTTLR